MEDVHPEGVQGDANLAPEERVPVASRRLGSGVPKQHPGGEVREPVEVANVWQGLAGLKPEALPEAKGWVGPSEGTATGPVLEL